MAERKSVIDWKQLIQPKEKEAEGWEEKFWSKIKKTDTCWLWLGYKQRYSQYKLPRSFEQRNQMAHRLVWEMLKGPIPKDLLMYNKCGNKLCVRPEHWFLGTQAIKKGRPEVMKKLIWRRAA
jgi:hypothetical protein